MADIRTIKTLKEDIKAAFAANPEAYLKIWFPKGKREGSRFRIGDTDGESGRSLSINIDSNNPGMGKDHNTDENIKDVIDLYARVYGCPTKGPGFRETLAAMASDFGVDDRPNGAVKPNGQWRVIAEWTYCGHDGEPWCTVKRSENEHGNKEIRPYSPDGKLGRPDYVGLLPLYNLAEVREADIVLVVEGEKCAEAARGLGIVATTSISGASQAGKSDWSLLDGKRIVLWPDNDVAGRKYIDDVADLCKGALSINLVEIPDGVSDKWDIADAVAGGVDVRLLIDGAISYSETKRPRTVIAKDLQGKPLKDIEYVIDGWLPRGYVTSLYGPGGSGKSLLALQIAACVSAEQSFFGYGINGGPVLCVFAEDDEDQIHYRLSHICKRLVITFNDLNIEYIGADSRPCDNPDFTMFSQQMGGDPNDDYPLKHDIEYLCDDIKPKVLILDNAARLFAADENSRSQVSIWVSRLASWARKYNMAVLLLGHTNKAGKEYSGSSAWSASARSLCHFSRVDDEDFNSPVRLELSKSNYSGRKDLVLKWEDWSFKLASSLSEEEKEQIEERKQNARSAVLFAIPYLNEMDMNTSRHAHVQNFLGRVMEKIPGPDGSDLMRGLSRHAISTTLEELIMEKIVIANQPLGWSEHGNKKRTLVIKSSLNEVQNEVG